MTQTVPDIEIYIVLQSCIYEVFDYYQKKL